MKTKVNDKNRVDYIMEYEGGDISDMDVLHLFANLIENGMAWSLQGHYGKTAKILIDGGWIDKDGVMNKEQIEKIYSKEQIEEELTLDMNTEL